MRLVIGNKNYSSWSLRPWLVLKQTGVPFEETRIPLDTPDTRRQILEFSPTGKVPVLIDGDLTIWDSLAIAEYLAEQYPAAKLWPSDVKSRAWARSVSAEMHSGFMPLRSHMSMDLRAARHGQGRTPEVLADIARIVTIWRDCRAEYAVDGDFLFGAFTIADAMYAPVVSRFRTYGVPLDGICEAYAEAILALPAMQAWSQAAHAEVEDLPNHN